MSWTYLKKRPHNPRQIALMRPHPYNLQQQVIVLVHRWLVRLRTNHKARYLYDKQWFLANSDISAFHPLIPALQKPLYAHVYRELET